VCLEGGNAKTLLIIEEEVDLSRKKVTMVHGEVYAPVLKWVSAETEEIFGVESGLKSAVRGLTKRTADVSRMTGCSSLGFQVLESAPELMSRAMDVGLHGA
jgi:hypothetical protein